MMHRQIAPLILTALLWSSRAVAFEPLMAAGKVPAPAPPPGSMYLHPERIRLEAGGLGFAERGVIFVPVNRSRPENGVLSLDVWRFPAAQPKAGAAPIFLLYGGPSFEGLEPLLSRLGYYEKRLQLLHQNTDLVVVSQRGIGPSKPTTLIHVAKPFPLDRAVTTEERREAVRSAAAREKEFWVSQGLDLTGFTALEAAADLNDVRKAFGYERIVLWGGSFGSHWAMATMRRYPEIVERAVLRGMEGPDHTYDMPSHVLNSIRRLAAEADRAPALAGMIPEGGLLAAFEKVIEKVAANPVVVNVKNPNTGAVQAVRFGPEDVRDMADGYTASASSRGGMRTWAADMIALSKGDFTGAAEERVKARETENFRTASYFMLDCGSGITPRRRAQLAADPAVAILGPLGFNYMAACPVWNIDLGDAFRQNFDTQIPTIIVQGDYDVSTPLDNALELAPFFKKGKLIVVHGGSHPALDDAMDAFPEFAKAVMSFAVGGDTTALPAEVQLPPIQWVIPSLTK